MKQLNSIPSIYETVLGITVGLSFCITGCRAGDTFSVYHYDNGDDYFSDGLQRIVDKDGKIGFRDSIGKVVITPRFAFAFPFHEGYAEVSDSGHLEAVDKNGEYHRWVSDSWYYIDHAGTKYPELIGIRNHVTSYSTNDKLRMTIVNPEALKMPIDSIVVEMINNSDEEATFGEYYKIERDVDGKWETLPYNNRIRKILEQDDAYMVFDDIGYLVRPRSSRKYANPTKAYNEKLIPGRYRISKTFHYPPYPTLKSDTAYVEFDISEDK